MLCVVGEAANHKHQSFRLSFTGWGSDLSQTVRTLRAGCVNVSNVLQELADALTLALDTTVKYMDNQLPRETLTSGFLAPFAAGLSKMLRV